MRDRQQFVEYVGYVSEPYHTRSGVSQGSNLGPFEFILMVNDLPDVLKEAKCLLFADDLKLYMEIGNQEDCERLQKDIDRVVAWSHRNGLQFNTSKCLTITFSRARHPIVNNYKIADVLMTRVSELRDLGVQLTSKLSFKEHIEKICKKAYRNLGFILRRAYDFKNIGAVIALYNTLVRSHLECNAGIWAPHETKYTLMLERIQNKFIRYLYLKQYGVYPFYPLKYPTLFILGMVGYNELRVRRQLAIAVYMFRLIRGKINNPELLERISFNVPDRYAERRRKPRLLAEPRARTNLLREAPLTRATRLLNQLSDRVDLFGCNMNEFTRAALSIICYD
ncbi:unnamed protein product [Euphydryas editha]|uniref:Reverse transcriptase domain-containing protein n=1 Tax=Euphydryas editha TaxID=104508 RepID=A0AAU9UDX0_EUPED|nr:unnamed protein product [Euphydryas editha]